jgi:hypothetical protein
MKSENNAAQRPAARVPCQVTALITARGGRREPLLIRGVPLERVFKLGSQALDMLMQGDFQFGGQHGETSSSLEVASKRFTQTFDAVVEPHS